MGGWSLASGTATEQETGGPIFGIFASHRRTHAANRKNSGMSGNRLTLMSGCIWRSITRR